MVQGMCGRGHETKHPRFCNHAHRNSQCTTNALSPGGYSTRWGAWRGMVLRGKAGGAEDDLCYRGG